MTKSTRHEEKIFSSEDIKKRAQAHRSINCAPLTRTQTERELPADTDNAKYFDVVIATNTEIRLWDNVYESLQLAGVENYLDSVPVCVGHRRDQLPIGHIVRTYQDESDLRAVVKILNDDADGSRVIKGWGEGVSNYLSVGYRIDNEEKVDRGEDTVFIVNRWTLMEVSVVAVPADPLSSSARDAQPTDTKAAATSDTADKINLQTSEKGSRGNDEATQEKPTTATRPKIIMPDEPAKEIQSREDQIEQLAQRFSVGVNLGDKFARELEQIKATAFASVDMSLETFRQKVREAIERASPDPAEHTPEKRAEKEASVHIDAAKQIGKRATAITFNNKIRNFVHNGGHLSGEFAEQETAMAEAGLITPQQMSERSFNVTMTELVSDVVRGSIQHGGLPTRLSSHCTPELIDLLRQRAQVTGQTAQNVGQDYIDTVLQAALLTPHLFDSRVLHQIGIVNLMGLSGDIFIPSVTSDVNTQIVSEVGALSDQTISTGGIMIQPRRLGTTIEYSRLIELQSSIGIQGLISYIALESLEVEKEKLFFQGDGSGNNPRGVFNLNGTLSFPTGTNGGKPTYQNTLDWMRAMEEANVPAPYSTVMTPGVKSTLMSTPLNAAGGDRFILDRMAGTVGNTLTPILDLNGTRGHVSNLLPKNGTKGSGTNLNSLVVGNWNASYACMWGNSVQVTLDQITKAKEATNVITFNCFFNFGHAQPTRLLIVDDISVS